MNKRILNEVTFKKSSLNKKVLAKTFKDYGVVLIKNFFNQSSLDKFINEANHFLLEPMVNGNFGFFKVDHPKKFVDPFQMSLNSKLFCLNEELIDIVEHLMNSKCILSEATIKFDKSTAYEYFGPHNDYVEGTKRSKYFDKTVSKSMINSILAIGGVLYLHDCKEGSFYYLSKSHKFKADKGQLLNKYPKEVIYELEKGRVKLDGAKGDLVLFDDRGFHGPSQPSKKDRLVLLLDWFNEKSWKGKFQMRPFTILSSEIDKFSKKQNRVMGVGSKPMENLSDYHIYSKFRKKKSLTFSIIKKIIEYSFYTDHIAKNIKTLFRS